MSNLAQQQVPEGYKQTEVGVIPSDWSVKKISDLSQVIRGASPRPKGDKRYYGGSVPRLMVQDVTRAGMYVTPQIDFLTEAGKKLSRPCEAGTLTLVCSGTVGVPSILAVDACIHDGFLALIKLVKGIDRDYLYQFFKTQQEKFDNSATHGGVFTNLTTDGVREFLVPVPSEVKEQTAIANALSDVDALIVSLEKLIAKKRAIKTAAMQQLLTGKKRLPPFDQAHTGYKQTELGEIPEDWEVKSYGQAFNFLTTASNSRSDLHDNGDYQYIHYGDIHVKWDSIVDFSADQIPKINSGNVSNATLLKDGDLIMADASEDYDGIGKSVEVTGLGGAKAVSGLHTFLLRDVGVFSEGYRGYLHQIKTTKKSFDRLATGLKVYGLSKGNLKSVLLPVPPKVEQVLITEVLSDMAGEIDSLNERLSKTQQLKQGMMQELLTGRTRLV